MKIELDREEVQSILNLVLLRALKTDTELHSARSDEKVEELEGCYRYYMRMLNKIEAQLENGVGA